MQIAKVKDHTGLNRKDIPQGYILFVLRVIGEKDAKLSADELNEKRMTFYSSGFNFNDRSKNV